MRPEQDFEGLRASGTGEKSSLLTAVEQYVGAWQHAMLDSTRPAMAYAERLNLPLTELQRRSIAAGFGGIAHHLTEYARLLTTNVDPQRLRTQLAILAELAAQARQTLPPEGQSGPPLAPQATPSALGLAPPPLITVAGQLDPALAAALRAQSSSPAVPTPARIQPARGPALGNAVVPQAVAAPLASASPLAAAAVPAASFSVRNMLGLRAFDRSGQRSQPVAQAASKPAAVDPSPALLGLGRPTEARTSARPPLVKSALWGLPALPDRQTGDSEPSPPNAPYNDRYSAPPPRSLWRPSSSRAQAPGAGHRTRPVQIRREASRIGLWVGLGGALVVAGLVVSAVLLFRHPSPSAAGQPSSHSASGETSSVPGVQPPRERLTSDDERFMALLSQVHGHGGGTESPELRSLIDEQAALASKALSGKCNDNSPRCKAWASVRDLIVGDRKTSIVKRRRGSDTETTRSGWMVGLKMPGIPVEDDPRVLRVFEFYTENPVGRETFQSMLFRCGAYRDLIQSTLIRYDLPPELLALVFAESSCVPTAQSPVGAAGLWQFMPDTGRAYHLNIVEGAIDERLSPFKSTEAGIRMLSDLRHKLGSWDLVFASYNLGPFGVLARLEKAGPDASFWDLVDADLLPEETANYAPTVDAIALILANLARLKFAGVQISAPQLTADLEVAGGTRLSLVARAAATSVNQLRSLNLDFSGDVVPVIPGGSIAVQVPKDVVWQARDAIKELLTSKDRGDQCVGPSFDWGKQRFTPQMDQACQRRLSAEPSAQ